MLKRNLKSKNYFAIVSGLCMAAFMFVLPISANENDCVRYDKTVANTVTENCSISDGSEIQGQIFPYGSVIQGQIFPYGSIQDSTTL